jgi:hypothetical protein
MRPTTFSQKIVLKATAEITKAIDTAATRHIMSRSEYVRRALIERLERDGMAPAQTKAA